MQFISVYYFVFVQNSYNVWEFCNCKGTVLRLCGISKKKHRYMEKHVGLGFPRAET